MPVAPKMVFAFKRKVRSQLKAAAAKLQSLLDYSTAHEDIVPPLFTADEFIAANAVRATLLAKLLVKKQK